jgi:hypothetical protein
MYLRAAASVLLSSVVVALAACGGDDHAATNPAPVAARARMSTVPDLIGRRQAVAHRIANRAGFTLVFRGFAGKLAHGRYNVGCAKIHSQSPVGGERRPRGAQIAVIEVACKLPREGPQGIDW